MQTNCQLFKCDCHVTTKSMRYLNLILDCFVQHVVATQGCVELNTDSQSCFCHFALQPCAFVLSTTSGCWSGAVHSAARLQLCEEHIGFGVCGLQARHHCAPLSSEPTANGGWAHNGYFWGGYLRFHGEPPLCAAPEKRSPSLKETNLLPWHWCP